MSYVRGKYAKAACSMLDWLRDNQIKGGPVAQPSKGDPSIVVYGMTKDGIEKLPETFEGFRVVGTTDLPDYERLPLHDSVPKLKGDA